MMYGKSTSLMVDALSEAMEVLSRITDTRTMRTRLQLGCGIDVWKVRDEIPRLTA